MSMVNDEYPESTEFDTQTPDTFPPRIYVKGGQYEYAVNMTEATRLEYEGYQLVTAIPPPPNTGYGLLLNGAGVPDPLLGRNNDFYINTSATPRKIYGPKVANNWGSGVPL